MKSLFLVIAVFLLSYNSFAQPVTYDNHDEIISNPERGLYHHTEVHSGNYSLLDLETLKGFRENESITQILRVFYLENFRDTPISEDYLNNIRKDFSTIRKAGIKCIIRFAYTTKSTAPYNDATPEMVQTHINQLKPVLKNNADVIEVMQVGFIGAWGEWYYTDHFANSPGNIDAEDWENRRKVVYSLLDALTPDRMVQIRTPGYKMTIFDTKDPLNESTAFANEYMSRTGHHNDCFVASSSDYGTYINPDIEKPYLNQETRYTPMGGETCALASPYSDCDKSVSELERFHWSYLNIDYNSQVLNEWDNQGCFDEVVLKLGYRYELLDGTFTTEVQPTGTFSFDLNLKNVGYSNPYNPRNVEIILRNQSSGELYQVMPDTDIRLWPLGEPINLQLTAGIPDDMPVGDYDLLLNLPDPYKTLHDNPAYSIQFANLNTWESATGYNNLNQTVTVSTTANEVIYMGDNKFQKIASLNETLEIEGSKSIFGSSGSNAIMIYWGRQNTSLQRIIERSTNDGPYQIIASIPADQDYYLDSDVSNNSSYTYQYYLTQGSEKTITSNSTEQMTNDISTMDITVDGSKEDWGVSPVLSSASNEGEVFNIRMFFDAKEMYVLLEGPVTEYQLYLNTDNNLNTGFASTEGPALGADYLIADGMLKKYDSDWINIGESTSSNQEFIREFSTSLSLLTNLTNQKTISVYAELNDNATALMDQSGNAFKAHRNLPPDTPKNLTITKSTTSPDTRLLINWEACEHCDGYRLERSTDEKEFVKIGVFDAQTIETRDDNLQKSTIYHYRIASFNQLGQSEFSELASQTTGTILGLDDTLIAYPNPTGGGLYLPETFEQIAILSLDGKVLQKVYNSNFINISSLNKGLYVIQVEDQNTTRQMKVIKQ